MNSEAKENTWNLKYIFYWMKAANLKRPHTVQFQLYEFRNRQNHGNRKNFNGEGEGGMTKQNTKNF